MSIQFSNCLKVDVSLNELLEALTGLFSTVSTPPIGGLGSADPLTTPRRWFYCFNMSWFAFEVVDFMTKGVYTLWPDIGLWDLFCGCLVSHSFVMCG